MLAFLAAPFVASLILTGIHAYLGVHVVERGVIFVDLSLAQIASFGALGTQLAGFSGAPKCGIDVHHFEYATVGAAGEKTTASGALMVPTGSDPACTGSRPLMMYAHGSSEVHGVDMTALTPQAPYGVTSIEVAALFAAQGWIVIAPNYAGYDTSTLTYHSHHIADQESKDMMDALAAAQHASVRRLASLLPGHTPVYPTHGFGSFCAAGPASGGPARASTIAMDSDQPMPASLPRPFILARAAMAPYCFIMVRICRYCLRTWFTSWTVVPLPVAMRLRRLPSMTL